MNYRNTVKEFAVITVGTLIVAAAVFFFMMPSHVTVGSATALAMVISNFLPLPVSVITLIMNVGLLLIGFLLIGPEFGVKTVYCAILLPVLIGVFEFLLPDFQSFTQDPLLDVVCYILVVAVGLSVLFSHNASSGGLDIVAKIMNKFLRMELGRAMSISGMLIALSSAFVYDKKTVVITFTNVGDGLTTISGGTAVKGIVGLVNKDLVYTTVTPISATITGKNQITVVFAQEVKAVAYNYDSQDYFGETLNLCNSAKI